MSKITKEQYELALARIEELLPMVDENTPLTDRNASRVDFIGFGRNEHDTKRARNSHWCQRVTHK